jgi:hypothetical protein
MISGVTGKVIMKMGVENRIDYFLSGIIYFQTKLRVACGALRILFKG